MSCEHVTFAVDASIDHDPSSGSNYGGLVTESGGTKTLTCFQAGGSSAWNFNTLTGTWINSQQGHKWRKYCEDGTYEVYTGDTLVESGTYSIGS